MVTFLLERDANIHAVNIYGQTALHVASYEGHLEVARLLLDRGANINAQNADDEIPFAKIFTPFNTDDFKLKMIKLFIEHSTTDLNSDGALGFMRQVLSGNKFQDVSKQAQASSLLFSSSIIKLEHPNLLSMQMSEFSTFLAIEGYENQKVIAGVNLYNTITAIRNEQNQNLFPEADLVNLQNQTLERIELITP